MKNNICLLANSKGGSGGSTLISFLATLFATNYKLKVLVIDAHTCQHSLYDCRDHELRNYPYLKPLYEIVKVDSKDVIVYLTSLKQDYDTIFIDWSGRVGLDDYFNNIVFSANIVIVPMIAWDINIEPTLSYIKYIRAIKNKKMLWAVI